MRKLPPSFWNPPPAGSKSPASGHSRENSMDASPMSPNNNQTDSPQANSGAPFHSRAHSSPASLQQTLALAASNNNPQQPTTGQATQNQAQSNLQHLRQPSYDVTGVNGDDNLGPLPPGWEKAKTPTGQVYFMNHITKTTQWEDPRKQQPLNASLPQINTTSSELQPPTTSPPSPSRSDSEDLGPLPEGWEQGKTDSGEVYYINHVEKKTTWFDPRQQQPQQPQQQQLSRPMDASGALPGMTAAQRRQQDARLQRLEIERRNLQRRQEEISRQMERRQRQDNIMQQTQVINPSKHLSLLYN